MASIAEKYKDTVPPGISNPLDNLTGEQTQKMKELRQVTQGWGLAKPEQEFVNDMCLYRFLSGLGWDVKVASGQLKETCDWRASFKPQEVKLKDCKEVAKYGYMFHHGYDKKFRPIVYLDLGKDKGANDEQGRLLKFRNVVYIMEDCIKKMPKGVYNITWIIDASNASLTLGMVKQMKDMFSKLGDYYTERLAMAFVLNVPWTLSLIWSFIKNFLEKETVEKYQLISGDTKTLKKDFLKYIDEDQLLGQYGGTAKYTFDLEKLLKEEEQGSSSTTSSSSNQ